MATNKGQKSLSFFCDAQFSFPDSNLSTCFWNSDGTTLIVSDSKVSKAGDQISLLPDILRSRCADTQQVCTSYPTSPSQQCTILLPDTPIVPVVEFQSPSVIGSRDNFLFDISTSSGSGGRSWNQVFVDVSAYQGSFSKARAIALEKLSPLEELFAQSFPSKMVIPSSLFLSNYTYYFNVTVCNFLQVCSLPYIQSVFKELSPVPMILIYGSKERVVRRSDVVTISASAMLNTSNGILSSSEINNGLNFKWEVFQGSLQLALASTSKDQTKFRIPSYSLAVGLSYRVRLTVTSASHPSSATSSVTVSVKQSGVVAVINDGQQMYLLKQGRTLLLDGSGSYDSDISGVKGSDAGLAFDWSCATIEASMNCSSYFNLSFDSNNAIAQLVELGRSRNQIYWSITLTVTSFASIPVRTNSVSVLVRVIPPTAPTLYLTGPSQIRSESTLILAGFVNSTTKVTAHWWSDTLPNLSTLLLTPSSVALSKGSNRVNLVIPRNILSPGSSYLFHLSIDNTSSSAFILVNVISTPRPGFLTVFPKIGTEYETEFQFDALSWSDSELPLTYSYGYYSPSQVQYFLQTRTESTSFTTLLPKGNAKKGNVLHCFILVYNNLNVSTRLNISVVVNPASSERKLAVLNSILSQTASVSSRPLDESEVETIRQNIILGTSVLNSVDCSFVSNCDSLNREACGEISNQCGSCLSGFFELDVPDPFSTCLTVDSIGSNDASCTTSLECSSLQSCETNKCTFLSKFCPSDCSGQGVCRFEKISTGKNVDNCFANDVTCRAVCDCNSDFIGPICSTEISQLPQLQKNRHSLLTTLNYTFGYGEETGDALNSLISLLLDLSSAPDELSSESCSLLMNMVGKVLHMISASDSDLNYEDVMTMFPIFNTCLSILSNDPAITIFNLAIEKLITTISTTLMSGISPQEVVQSSIRMTSVTQSVDSTDPLVVKIPSTALETSLDLPKSSILYSSSKSSVSVTAVERLSRYQNEVSNSLRHLSQFTRSENLSKKKSSNSLHVVVQRLDDESLDDVSTILVVLQLDQEQVYGNISGTNVTFQTICNDTAIHKYECPSGEVISHDCSEHEGLRVISICSMQQRLPSCAVLDDSPQVRQSNCSVVSYTSKNTTCICRVPFTPTSNQDSSRKSSSTNNHIGSSSTVTVIAMSQYTTSGFTSTVVQSDGVTVGKVRSSILVLAMFIVLWGFGSIFLIEDLRLTGNWYISPKKPRSERSRTGKGALIVPLDPEESLESQKKYLVTYLNSIFPEVFRQEGTWSGLLRELLKHHRYILLFQGQGSFSYEQRVKTLLQLLTVQTMLMFVLAVCYDLQYPSDDGQCETYETESACLGPSSILDSTQQMCKWIVTSSDVGSCLYLEPTLTLKVIVLISLVVATATAPFNFVVDLLFEVIRAPTADSDRLKSLISSGNTSIQRIGRRMSAVALGASKAVVSKVNTFIPVSNSVKEKSILPNIFDTFVQDVARDVPDSVAYRHALASTALKRSSYPKKKGAVIPTNGDIPDESDETPYTLGLVKRKQLSTLFLSDVEPTPRDESPADTAPFTSVSPSSSSRGKKNAQMVLFESLVSELCDQYGRLTGVSHREEFSRTWG
jgi:hypothetical protein